MDKFCVVYVKKIFLFYETWADVAQTGSNLFYG